MSDTLQRERTRTALGLLLVVVGLVFLAEQAFGLQLFRISWPFYVILPGLALLGWGMLGGRSAAPLAIPGTIVSTVGFILLYQNTFGLWASWAYIWTLIAPTAVGAGMMIAGNRGERPALTERGRRLVMLGLALFAVGWTFFEVIINLNGFGGGLLAKLAGPALLIAGGVYLLLRRSGRRSGDETLTSQL